MLPGFLLEEIAVRECGESDVFDLAENVRDPILLTFSITHAVEQESIILEIYGSKDGNSWSRHPIASFPPKYYCGDYQIAVRPRDMRYLKAEWRVNRWSRGDSRPYFRFYVCANCAAHVGAAMAGAA